jgi:hypothetical protein
MSSNNEAIIVKKAEGRFEVFDNGCVDNEYDYHDHKPLFIAISEEDAREKYIDFFGGFEPEYGFRVIDETKGEIYNPITDSVSEDYDSMMEGSKTKEKQSGIAEIDWKAHAFEYLRKHGWYQDKNYIINPEAWFHPCFPLGEEIIDSVKFCEEFYSKSWKCYKALINYYEMNKDMEKAEETGISPDSTAANIEDNERKYN